MFLGYDCLLFWLTFYSDLKTGISSSVFLRVTDYAWTLQKMLVFSFTSDAPSACEWKTLHFCIVMKKQTRAIFSRDVLAQTKKKFLSGRGIMTKVCSTLCVRRTTASFLCFFAKNTQNFCFRSTLARCRRSDEPLCLRGEIAAAVLLFCTK